MIIIGVVFGWLFCLGGLIALIGLIVTIIGLVEAEEPKPSRGAQTARAYLNLGPPGSVNFCEFCGHQIAPDGVRCPGCGRPVAGSTSLTPVSAKDEPLVTVTCPSCGTQNQGSFRFCSICGRDLRSKTEAEIPMDTLVVCPDCGAKNMRTEQFCGNCDKDLTDAKKLLAEKSRR